jgi:hypothetical protein
MKVSLNQVEQAARKAARGHGLDWGLAEDCGKAVRWLQSCGIDGIALLADLLERQRDLDYGKASPQSLRGTWSAPAGTLSPLVTGASICDVVGGMGDQPVVTGPIDFPGLVAGFAGGLAQVRGVELVLSWADSRACCSPQGLAVSAGKSFLYCDHAPALACEAGSCEGEFTAPTTGGVPVDRESWDTLQRYAHLTCVEASEQSRSRGAGAEVDDND